MQLMMDMGIDSYPYYEYLLIYVYRDEVYHQHILNHLVCIDHILTLVDIFNFTKIRKLLYKEYSYLNYI